jgi:hypothetical protein
MMYIKKTVIIVFISAGLLLPFTLDAQDEAENSEAAPKTNFIKDKIGLIKSSDLLSLSLRWDYLNKRDSTQDDDYTRFMLTGETDNRFLNPSGGVEFRVDDSQVRSYWIGDDIRFNERTRFHLRLNHLEFADWETAINHANFYVSYKRWWLRASLGMGYAALVFEDKYYKDPFHWASENPESRFIYELSLRPTFRDKKFELDFGLKNFDNFEYHGFDDNGYHFEPVWHINDKTTLSVFYERRYAAAFVSIPTLTRVTWMISIERKIK